MEQTTHEIELNRLRRENQRLVREIELYRRERKIVAGGITLVLFGPRLVASLRSWLSKTSPELPLPVDETAELAAAVIRRMISIGLIGLLFASIPSILLWKQNRLFKDLTEQANYLTSVQNTLLEAETKESQLQRKLAKLNLLGRQEEAVNEFINRLRGVSRVSNSLQDKAPSLYPPRAKAACVPLLRESLPELRNLSRTLKPIKGEKSTARGRLLADLLALPACELQPLGTEYWVSGPGMTSFAEEVGNLIHPRQFLRYVPFDNADFSGLDLSFSSLLFLSAPDSRFDGASLIGSQLTGADLRRSSFMNTHLAETWLQGALLQGADLSSAIGFSGPPFDGLNVPSYDDTTQLPPSRGEDGS
ncbi:MAG: pentapeptide repeat-containing protein [bacterium]|nr:pentapeptide repeat-containing protein [bacterium]